MNEHTLDRYVDLGQPATVARFDSDPRRAEAWDGLTQGTHTQADMDLLKHEAAEAWVERTRGAGYSEAHDRAQQSFPSPLD